MPSSQSIIRTLIKEELTKVIFPGLLNENELYIDITEMPITELYEEELLRLSLGYGKAGYVENGKYFNL